MSDDEKVEIKNKDALTQIKSLVKAHPGAAVGGGGGAAFGAALGGPIGAAAGGALGGFLGGLFDDDDGEKEETQE